MRAISQQFESVHRQFENGDTVYGENCGLVGNDGTYLLAWRIEPWSDGILAERSVKKAECVYLERYPDGALWFSSSATFYYTEPPDDRWSGGYWSEDNPRHFLIRGCCMRVESPSSPSFTVKPYGPIDPNTLPKAVRLTGMRDRWCQRLRERLLEIEASEKEAIVPRLREHWELFCR